MSERIIPCGTQLIGCTRHSRLDIPNSARCKERCNVTWISGLGGWPCIQPKHQASMAMRKEKRGYRNTATVGQESASRRHSSSAGTTFLRTRRDLEPAWLERQSWWEPATETQWRQLGQAATALWSASCNEGVKFQQQLLANSKRFQWRAITKFP